MDPTWEDEYVSEVAADKAAVEKATVEKATVEKAGGHPRAR